MDGQFGWDLTSPEDPVSGGVGAQIHPGDCPGELVRGKPGYNDASSQPFTDYDLLCYVARRNQAQTRGMQNPSNLFRSEVVNQANQK